MSPWPSALLVRYFFDKGGLETAQNLEAFVDEDAIVSRTDLSYDTADDDARFDLFAPAAGTDRVAGGPTIVWVHVGGWVSGSKNDVANYLKILASRGFTVVGLDYSIAPGATYPTPVKQVLTALEHLRANAQDYGIDPDSLVLAGDSAGSQIASQVATILTSPDYAANTGIGATIPAQSLVGVILFCGAYDIGLADVEGAFGGFLETVLWSYSGTRDYMNMPGFEYASVANHVTDAFPPAFISAGNADALAPQSVKLAKRLTELGVPATELFFAPDHEPALNHEYQFDLRLTGAQVALDESVAFLTGLAQVSSEHAD